MQLQTSIRKVKSGLLYKIRPLVNFWVAKRTMGHLASIRRYELEQALRELPKIGHVLEIGAESGWQAKALANRGYVVSAIDIQSCNYKTERVWSVTEYDGHKIPFPDQTFDIVFSSNTLEHIPHLYDFQKEIQRVLKQDGIACHLLPSSTWRWWTNITHLLKNWTYPEVHGEHAGGPFNEIAVFSERWWSRFFARTGWVVSKTKSNRLFYTGESMMDDRLSIKWRARLSRLLGGSCTIYWLRR